MSLLSKLLGKAGSELGLEKLVETVAEAAGLKAEDGEHGKPKAEKPETEEYVPAAAESAASGPSGFSWGEVMPAEENQFNFNGSYDQYFEQIFRAEFPAYRLERENAPGGRRVIFTFRDGDRKALVVELMNQSSEARKLRSDCLRAGIPYLRYYYDHEGWWNTRAYVVERTRKALEG